MSTQAQIPNAMELRMMRSITFMAVPSFWGWLTYQFIQSVGFALEVGGCL